MKRLFSFIMASCVVVILSAQSNPSTLFNPHNQSSAGQIFPGRIGQGFNVVEVTFTSLNFSIGNNAMSYNQIYNLITDPKLTDGFISSTIASMKPSTRIYANADVHLLGVHFNLKDRNRKKYASISLSVTEKAMANFLFPKQLFEVLYEGNSQYGGETVSFSPIGGNALYYHDINLGFSMPLMINRGASGIEITPGMRLRYLKGVASAQTKKAEFSMFTEADGKYIHFDYDYHFNASLPKGGVAGILQGNGNGIGVDLGATVKVNEMFSADIAVNDIGFIQFGKNAKNYSKNGEYRYEGLEFNLWEADVTEWSNIDSLLEIFNADESSDAYKVNLQPKISLMGTLTLMPMMSKKQERFFQHNIYMSYTQGFKKELDKNTTPVVGLGYIYSLKNIFNIGPNFTFGGYTGFALGFHTSVKAGPVKFGIGSNDISPLIMKNNGKGANAQASFALSF